MAVAGRGPGGGPLGYLGLLAGAVMADAGLGSAIKENALLGRSSGGMTCCGGRLGVP